MKVFVWSNKDKYGTSYEYWLDIETDTWHQKRHDGWCNVFESNVLGWARMIAAQKDDYEIEFNKELL